VSHAGIGSGPGTANRAREPVMNAVTITEITLAAMEGSVARQEHSQFVVATHSPILLGHPTRRSSS